MDVVYSNKIRSRSSNSISEEKFKTPERPSVRVSRSPVSLEYRISVHLTIENGPGCGLSVIVGISIGHTGKNNNDNNDKRPATI